MSQHKYATRQAPMSIAPCPWNRLPVEVLLNIAHHLPDLRSISCLDGASIHFAAVFSTYGAEILESVMGPSLPLQTRQIIRIVVLLRSETSQPTLDIFFDQHFRERPISAACNPIPPETPQSVLRDILSTATVIADLTDHCLSEFMHRCLALRPSHLLDKTPFTKLDHIRHFSYHWPQYPCQPYTPQSSGPPSWLEMHRAMNALWSLHLYLDLVTSIFSGRIAWADEGLGWDAVELRWMYKYYQGVETLAERDGRSFSFPGYSIKMISEGIALDTVVEFLEDFYGWKLPSCRREDVPVDGCSTIDEEKQQSLRLPSLSPEARSIDWEHEGIGPFPGCDDESRSNALPSSPTEFERLFFSSPAEDCIVDIFHWSRVFPELHLEFKSFQRLGIAFWDDRRLMALRLLRPHKEASSVHDRRHKAIFRKLNLFYTWKSIEPQEEIEELTGCGAA
ncbi:hypothetical protein VPNG_08049 [Cytospora leucostoma]|uniref:F-box domain-containing protein n=1 Tax=Cytospora leucostoma TaxID=1230097 RepID=A0A423WSG7_9PEZI|nr:hypothetical protein VPNG_08049 [Cytospora leucostoma]